MTTAPVEGKVSAGAQGTGAGLALYGFLLWLLGVTLWGMPADAAHAVAAAAAVPAPVIGLLALLPVGLGYACGYLAKHTPRPTDRPVIVKSDATTVPIDSPVVKAVADDLRRQLIEGRQMTEAGPDATPDA